MLYGTGAEIPELRKQLAAAQEATDNPAIIELSRRLLEAAPRDQKVWETLVRAQLDVADYNRCAATLDVWEKGAAPRPSVIDDLRGDVAAAREDYPAAEHYWRSYLAAQPKAVAALDKLANRFAAEGRWRDALDLRTRALAVNDTAPRRIDRANLYLALHEWDKALADADKANGIDPSDKTVKESLPQFELLKNFLPRIKALDSQIAKSPGTPILWLDRAHLFTLANRPNLALTDCEQARKLAPGMIRARIQAAEALQDLGRVNDAAKLSVSHDLPRDKNKHVNEEALRLLSVYDAQVLQNPNRVDPLIARVKVLRRLNQFVLALADAQAALSLDPDSPDAHFQAAHVFDALGRTKEAMSHVERATELNQNDPVIWYYRGLLEAKRADFKAAIQSQTRSLGIRESYVALLERENCERRSGLVAEADADAAYRKQFPEPEE